MICHSRERSCLWECSAGSTPSSGTEEAYRGSLLSVLLFCQLTLLIFYIPANNQIGLARTSLIAFICLAVAYVANRITRPLTPR